MNNFYRVNTNCCFSQKDVYSSIIKCNKIFDGNWNGIDMEIDEIICTVERVLKYFLCKCLKQI